MPNNILRSLILLLTLVMLNETPAYGEEQEKTEQTSPSSTEECKKKEEIDTSIRTTAKDSWITTKIKGQYAEPNSGLSVFKIHVETNEGVVHLSGSVGKDLKRKAIDLARETEGVKKVEAKDLVEETKANDTWITTKIKGKYAEPNSGLSVFKIHVETNEGVVHLSGSTGKDLKRKAIDLAKETEGVKKVEAKDLVEETK